MLSYCILAADTAANGVANGLTNGTAHNGVANGAANGHQKPAPRLMVCNRGEIARRVIRTANHHGLETIAIYTQVGVLPSQAPPADSNDCGGEIVMPTV